MPLHTIHFHPFYKDLFPIFAFDNFTTQKPIFPPLLFTPNRILTYLLQLFLIISSFTI